MKNVFSNVHIRDTKYKCYCVSSLPVHVYYCIYIFHYFLGRGDNNVGDNKKHDVYVHRLFIINPLLLLSCPYLLLVQQVGAISQVLFFLRLLLSDPSLLLFRLLEALLLRGALVVLGPGPARRARLLVGCRVVLVLVLMNTST